MSKTHYLIQAHADSLHLDRLVRRLLTDPLATVRIHLDAKSDLQEFQRACSAGNVCWVRDRVKVSWCGYSQVAASLRLLTEARATGSDSDYYVLLSGMCYPMRDMKEIARHLRSQPYRQHIRYASCAASSHRSKFTWRHYFMDETSFLPSRIELVVRPWLNRLGRLWPKRNFKGLEPVFGSTWWGLTGDCVTYVLNYINNRPQYAQLYKNSWCPDEEFYHTLIRNSPFHAQAAGFGIDQDPDITYLSDLTNLHFIHRNVRSVFRMDEFEEVMASGRCFIRKVNTGISDVFLNAIDHHIYAASGTMYPECPSRPQV